MIQLLAYGLDNGSFAAYLLIFLLVAEPLLFIILIKLPDDCKFRKILDFLLDKL